MIKWYGTAYRKDGRINDKLRFRVCWRKSQYEVWVYPPRGPGEVKAVFDLASEGQKWCEMMHATGALE